jgi:hypothetical protein
VKLLVFSVQFHGELSSVLSAVVMPVACEVIENTTRRMSVPLTWH